LVTFLHFSDFHILPDKGMVRDEGDPCKKVEKLIHIARGMDLRPAFSVITGDVSQDGTETGYSIAREYIAEIEALGGPVLPAVGNVDRRGNFRRILLGARELDDDKPCYYSRTVGGIRAIVLDSQVPGTERGALDKEQLDWLERELNGCAQPCVVAFHHPIRARTFDADHARRFRDITCRAKVIAVLCGHMHQNCVTLDDGICHVTGSAALSEVVATERSLRFYDSSGFGVLTYHDGALNIRPIVYSEGRRLMKETPRS
jgi:Icc protein